MSLGAYLRRAARILTARENAGVAAIEFAIYAMVFLMIVAATVDIGLLLFTQSQLDAAVSAGAEYAANNAALVASNPSGLNTNISNIVNNANGTGWATSTVNVNNGNDSTQLLLPDRDAGELDMGQHRHLRQRLQPAAASAANS